MKKYSTRNLISDDVARKMDIKYIPQEITLELSDKTFSNGLRRVLLGEVEASCMTFDDEAFSTTDPFLLNTYVKRNIMQVPIEQDGKPAEYKLEVVNDSPTEYKRVYTGDIKPMPKCNKNIELFELSPLSKMSLSRIYTNTNYGYVDFAYVRAFACRSIPNKDGGAKLIFETNGASNPKTALKEACIEIVNRFKSLELLIPSVTKVNGVYNLLVHGENDTLGELFTHATLHLFNVEFVTSFTNYEQNTLLIRIIYDENIKTLIKNVINFIADYYNNLIKTL